MKKKVGVFFNAGLGNSIVLVPLIKKLKREGNVDITAIFTDTFNADLLFSDQPNLIDHTIILRSNASVLKLLFKIKTFDLVFLDFFASTKKNLFIAKALSKEISAFKKEHIDPEFLNKRKDIHLVQATAQQHTALVNLTLWPSLSQQLSIEDFQLKKPENNLQEKFKIREPYICVQVGSGNSRTPYKTWAPENWKEIILHLTNHYATYQIVLIGDDSEKNILDDFPSQKGILNLLGKTSIEDLKSILSRATLFIGHDSGPMHISVCYNVPTLTIWGGSSWHLYGYHNMAPKKHKIVGNKLDCWPCNAWINPNTKRVSDPLQCPDFKCITHISTKQVIEVLDKTMKELND